MSLLMRNAKITTRYGGGFVQSIDGLSGGRSRGRPGRLVLLRQRDRGAEGRGGDERRTRATTSGGISTTGARPTTSPRSSAPFPSRSSTASKASACPVRIECAAAQSSPCRTVTARLRALGVPAAVAAIGSGAEPDALRVARRAPGRLSHGDPSVHGIESGPRTSGVYARFAPNGQTLTLLDGDGQHDRARSPRGRA